MTKKFGELSDGSKFKINDVEYEKIAAIKISCCKSINAKSTANESQTTYIQPSTDVEAIE